MTKDKKNMASKRQIRRKECGNKIKYETHEAANKVRKHVDYYKTNVYKCKWCGGFHIGHTPYGVRKILQARDRMNPA